MEISKKIDRFWKELVEMDASFKNSIILLLFFACSIMIFNFVVINCGVIPFRYVFISILCVILLYVVAFYFLFSRRFREKRVLPQIICGVFSVTILICSFFINASGQIFERVQVGEHEKSMYAVLIAKENKAKGLGNLGQAKVGTLKDDNTETVTQLLKERIKIASGMESYVDVEEYDNVYDLSGALLNKSNPTSVICLDQANLQILANEIDDFENKVKSVYLFEVESESEQNNRPAAITNRPFVVYFSAIDQYDISRNMELNSSQGSKIEQLANEKKGQSELNLILVVDPVNKKMLIVDTPADYLVNTEKGNDNKDKLAYTGAKGIDDSISAIEDLYGVEVDYFIRTTFNEVSLLIDEIGGIDVYSDLSLNSSNDSDLSIQRGMNHLDGSHALEYARWGQGDPQNDIGRKSNSRRIADAVIDKISSTDILWRNYSPILTVISGAFETNIPADLMTEIVRNQISDGEKWIIDDYTVTGSSAVSGISSLGENSPMVQVIRPDEQSVDVAKEKIQLMLRGK